MLVEYFVLRKARDMNLLISKAISGESMDQLIAYDLPGSIRELENIIELALKNSDAEELRFLPSAPALQALNPNCRCWSPRIFCPLMR